MLLTKQSLEKKLSYGFLTDFKIAIVTINLQIRSAILAIWSFQIMFGTLSWAHFHCKKTMLLLLDFIRIQSYNLKDAFL